jgi:predicted ribosomally synthesized peptide with SipW-like signal peptide
VTDEFKLSRRRTLAALGTIGAASAGAGLGTSAYFSDQETFENNRLVAGELDLKVSWDEHYSDWKGEETQYASMPESGETPDLSLPAADPNGRPIELVFSDRSAFMDATRQEQFPEGGLGAEEDPCEALADVGDDDTAAPVVSIDDVKPGDFGEVTFDFAACDNPAYLWMNGGLIDESENGFTEPELDDADEDGTATPSASSAWPLAALAAIPALGDDSEAGDESADADPSDRRSALRTGVAAAGAGAAGLGAASEAVAADEKGSPPDPETKGSPPDPDGNLDVSTSNANLSVTVGELGSNGFTFAGEPTVFFEEYGLRDGDSGRHVESSELSASNITDPFPSSVSAGTTAESTVSYPVPTAGGTSVDLEVDRNVTLDPTEPILRVEYEVTNPSGSGATFDDLRLSQYVDYDIGGISNNVGRYFFDPATNCEFIWQETTGSDIFAGFTGEARSVNHEFSTYSSGVSNFSSDDPTFDNEDVWPPQDTTDGDLETTDVELLFEWSLGELAPGETTTFRTSFVYNQEGQAEFQQQICQESPGEPQPAPGGPELADKIRARAWYDDGDNVNEDGEEVFLEGSLREVLSQLSSGNGVALSGNQSASAGGGTGRDCYSASPDVHYVAFQWWLPIDHGNEVQSDSVTFDLGFYTEQCRHNDGSGMNSDTIDA